MSVQALCIAIYAPMIYTALCIMLLMRAASITRAIGRGWGPENLEPIGECHLEPKKVEISWAQPPPTCPSNGFARIKRITNRALSIRGLKVVFCT